LQSFKEEKRHQIIRKGLRIGLMEAIFSEFWRTFFISYISLLIIYLIFNVDTLRSWLNSEASRYKNFTERNVNEIFDGIKIKFSQTISFLAVMVVYQSDIFNGQHRWVSDDNKFNFIDDDIVV
jgi:hypothetical protein